MKMPRVKWSREDERALREMNERKKAFDQQNLGPVKDVACSILREMMKNNESMADVDLFSQSLINHADAIRDALQPYDSGIRPAEESNG